MKTVVTHIGPDLDAITSVWLIKTFLPGWEEAQIAFVPAGTTLNGNPPDENSEIMHVDTGFGQFDHHQTDKDTCASKIINEHLTKINNFNDIALGRICELVNDVDHFKEVYYPNPTSDFWDFSIVSQIDGWRLLFPDDPLRVVGYGMSSLDAIYKTFTNKIWAESDIANKGIKFNSKWGTGLGMLTTNDETIHLAQKMGYKVVIRKDPRKHYLRIKSLPEKSIDLTPIYEILKKDEPQVTWFLHASRHMILNGSSKNPNMRPSQKSLEEVIKVFESYK